MIALNRNSLALVCLLGGLLPAWAEEPAPASATSEAAAAPVEAAADPHARSADHVEKGGHAAEKGGHTPDSHGADAHAGHGHGDHGGHDESDLSHGDAGPMLFQPQEWRYDLSIFTFVVFLLLLAILTKFAWTPIAHGLAQREATIARQIAEAKAGAEKAAQQLREYEARLAAATEEARQIVSQARKDAEVAKEKIMSEAQAAAAKERDRAVADITAAKNQALQEIAQKSVSTAISLASGIIRREVRPEDHEQLISQSLQQFSSLN